MRTHSGLGGLVSVTLMVGSLFLMSCSSSPPTTSQTTTETKPYGGLTVEGYFGAGGVGAETDPHAGDPVTFAAMKSPVFDSLVEMSPEGQIRPGIAERWDIAADGLSQAFYIRKGVKFHNGDDLTAADVKFSLERILALDNTHVDSPVWRAIVAGVDLKDDYTVVMRFKAPQFELLKGFDNLGGSAAIIPKKYFEEKGLDYFRRNPVGSGPWKVVNYVPGARFEFEAVENHWRATPKFKTITQLRVPEEATKIAMLKTGELDIASVVPDSVPGLKAAGVKILKHDGAGQSFLWLFYDMTNPQKYALGDVKVRKALSLAINRQEMADKIFGGFAEPSALWYVRPTAFFWDTNQLKPDPYDPEQAKKLLAEAGYPNGFSTKIWDAAGTLVNSTHHTAVAGYWQKIGVNATLVPIDIGQMSTMYRPTQKPEIWNTVYGVLTGGGVWQFERMVQAYHSTKGSPKNIKNARLDELIDKVPTTKDPAEKKKLALEAAVLAKNEYSTLAILDVQTIIAYGPKVGELVATKGMGYLPPTYEMITHGK